MVVVVSRLGGVVEGLLLICLIDGVDGNCGSVVDRCGGVVDLGLQG